MQLTGIQSLYILLKVKEMSYVANMSRCILCMYVAKPSFPMSVTRITLLAPLNVVMNSNINLKFSQGFRMCVGGDR